MGDLVYIKVYKDFINIAEALDNGQRGKLFLAMLQYANGREVTPLQGAEQIAFLMLKGQIDRDQSEHDTRSEINRENGRKGGRPPKTPQDSDDKENQIGFSENQKNQTVFEETEKSHNKEEQTKDKEEQTKDKEENIPPKGIPPKREKHGEYGRVLLTQDEYTRLLDEYGQAELDRCIRYVDEVAQSNGNKNGWKDWNLVIRRCHRENWGRRTDRGSAGNAAPERERPSSRYNIVSAKLD